MQIGQKIKKLRELKNLTQDYMAEQLNLKGQSAYSKLESGEVELTYSKLERIAEILGLEVQDIIGFDQKMVFNLIGNKKANALVINQVSYDEKKIYSDYIKTLKKENAELKRALRKKQKK